MARTRSPTKHSAEIMKTNTIAPLKVRTGAAGLILVMLALICGAGCQTKPAADSGFLADSARMSEQRERFPFDRVWINPGLKREKYQKLIISPVNTMYLMSATGWKAANPANSKLEQGAVELARFTRDTFIDAVIHDPQRRFQYAGQPGPGTAVLEIAIVELVPSKAALGALGLVAPLAKAPAVAVGSKVAGGNPSVAIEARLRDAVTGEVLAMMADREEPPFRPIDAKAVLWYGDAQDSIKTWARQFIELANTPPSQQVKDAAGFSLKPW
jgi:hypothetical protein